MPFAKNCNLKLCCVAQYMAVRLNRALFHLPLEEEKAFGLENLTYGTLTRRGIDDLVRLISVHAGPPENIYGFDLGCGDGELIYHLEQCLAGSRWEGVELSAHRVHAAVRDVVIWQGDMLQESYHGYNVLHADNLCLEPHIADALESKIAREFNGLYITYRKPENLDFLHVSYLLESHVLETSWGPHRVHVYYSGRAS